MKRLKTRADRLSGGGARERTKTRRLPFRRAAGVKPAWIAWYRSKHPLLRFVAALGVLVVLSEILLNTEFVLHRLVRHELEFFATTLAGVLRVFGEDAVASGQVVDSSRFNVKIIQGCDALRPAVLFASAVLASPVAWWTKVPGILAGTGFLMLMNLVRLVGLFYVGIHYRRVFDFMHQDVSQTGFILLVIFTWVVWAVWAVRKRVPSPDDSA